MYESIVSLLYELFYYQGNMEKPLIVDENQADNNNNEDEVVLTVKGETGSFLMESVSISRSSLCRLAIPPERPTNITDYWLNDEVNIFFTN